MANAVDRAVRAQGGAVVKPHQVKAMVLAARRAYKVQSDAGLVDDGVDFDSWRRATLHDVVGAAAPDSFRAVTQRDYAAVLGYFMELAGEERTSDFRLRTEVSSEVRSPKSEVILSDEQRRAIWSLNLVEGEVADAFGGRGEARRYADALLWRIHKTDRQTALPRQLWAVIFTLRNRAARKRAKTALGARGEAGVHLPPPGASKRFPAFSRGL